MYVNSVGLPMKSPMVQIIPLVLVTPSGGMIPRSLPQPIKLG